MNEEETKKTLKTMKENIDKKYLKTRNSLAIETVLNLLEKKDNEIERYKMMLAETHAKFLNSDLKTKRKNDEDLEMLNEGWKMELKKKEKIIELMAAYIAGLDIEEDICCKTEKYGECDQMAYGECEECIKAYFEREAEKC